MPVAVSAAHQAWVKYPAPAGGRIRKPQIDPYDTWKQHLSYLSCRPTESTSPPKNIPPPCPVYDMPPINPVPPPLRHHAAHSHAPSSRRDRVSSAPAAVAKSVVSSKIEVEEYDDQQSVVDSVREDDSVSQYEPEYPIPAPKRESNRPRPPPSVRDPPQQSRQLAGDRSLRSQKSRYLAPEPDRGSYFPPRTQQSGGRGSYFSGSASVVSRAMSSSWANATTPLNI